MIDTRKPKQPTGQQEGGLAESLTALPADDAVRLLRTLDRGLLQQALATEDQPASGKRHAQRQRTLRAAKAVYNNRSCVVNCQIRDISNAGCKILISNSASLPKHFELQIAGIPETRLCEIRWRKTSEIGVKFISPQGASAPGAGGGT
jgi:hypothetical protein